MTKNPEMPPIDPEEAAIQRMIAADPDDHEWTEAEFATARSLQEALPDLAAAILRDHPELEPEMRASTEQAQRRRGRPRVERPRQTISIRLDPDVIAKLRASGPGWQGRVNDILKAAKI